MQDTNNLLSMWMITYDQASREKVGKTKGVIPFHAEKTTVFLENMHLLDWYARKHEWQDSKFACLVSPNFFNKASKGRATIERIEKRLIENENVRVSYSEWQERETDVMLFGNGFSPGKNIILQANNFHGPDFSELTQDIFDLAGIDWDVKKPLHYPVFSNYWIAKPRIIEKYIETFLTPCMDIMTDAEHTLSDRLFADSKYRRKLSPKAIEEMGINYYPMHPFICERFFSVFLELEKQKDSTLTIKYF
jgi:hypothetical protein